MKTKQVMEGAVQMCACGKYNMPVVAVQVRDADNDYKRVPAWNIGYVCKRCSLHEIFYVAEGMLNTTPKYARKLVSS
jgi:hypothetical protein